MPFDDLSEEASNSTRELPTYQQVMEFYPGASANYRQGCTFMDIFNADPFSLECQHNLYYPFLSKTKWQFTSWLSDSGLSMATIDKLLSLDIAHFFPLLIQKHFTNLLNCSPLGPDGSFSPSKLSHPPSVIEFIPKRIYSAAGQMQHIYTEWLMGNQAWELQVGNCQVHPLLISLANILADILRKGSMKSYLLLALLPVPKFVHLNKCLCACWKWQLNGVSFPFWLDWALAEPSSFITPEPLHQFFKMFWDHDQNWCSSMLGAEELDFWFSLLQVLKFMDTDITKLTASLQEFHDNKSTLMEGGMQGLLDHWQIPKLEMILTVTPSILTMGALATTMHDIEFCGDSDDADVPDGKEDLLKSRGITVYFRQACTLIAGKFPTAPCPYQTFALSTTAFHLSSKLTMMNMTVDSVAEAYELPDFKSAIADYLHRCHHNLTHMIGGR
ncbi:hypothetical protein EDC04DRAFT_2608619 [Pisolithus marmoratus]|nr:hypothetical protein EDC04DRAFT_2608619 [Pisolithus marmoratus]